MSCPTPEIWKRFAAATLDDAEADELLAHLAACESCSKIVERLERQPDQLLLLSLRNLQAEPDLDDDTEKKLPSRIGQYDILRRIGQGGMGVVYQARHPHLERDVALKVIRESRLGDPAAKERFAREMQSLGKLTHPNIIHATDANIDGNTAFIVMELLDGEDLGSHIERHGKMPVKQAVDCIRQAATGLAYAHKAGYVHRDIKPSNLFLTRDGVVKILDLGLVRSAAVIAPSNRTETGQIVGSPDFMAPEQFRGGPVDARSDIYSLGQTFFFLLTGKAHGENDVAIPAAIKRILARMTAGLPEERYQTADEVIAALNKVTSAAAWKTGAAVVAVLIIVAVIIASIVSRSPKQPSEAVVPATVAPEPSQPPVDWLNATFFVDKFHVADPKDWDRFFKELIDFIFVTQGHFNWDGSYFLFATLNQLGRDADAERLLQGMLDRFKAGDSGKLPLKYMYWYYQASEFERSVGHIDKADALRKRIETAIANEPSELKRDEYRNDLATTRWSIPKMSPLEDKPKEYDAQLVQGDPSVKDSCDAGRFEEAIQCYTKIASSRVKFQEGGYESYDVRHFYRGHGFAYIVERMIEKGDMAGAKKLWNDAPMGLYVYFHSGTSLAAAFLKAGQKKEAQAVWDAMAARLKEESLRTAVRDATIYGFLKSIADSGLYEYVRTRYGK